ncbi:hypothetical protein [Bradyrhizobium canariense]|uniref:hypothetical protein n=1 Tax=Bradyrhizobium canariense TaxID=255045 RepID=UPI001FCCCC3B|nr:hypothetical protein [Bradyrhizobium canariense]
MASTSTAVDFALVLSRMIDAVNGDPEQLRATVYALARHKLDEQAASEDPDEQERLAHALEVAIKGVETHFDGMGMPPLGAPGGQLPRLGPPVDPAMAAQTAAALDSARLDGELDPRPWLRRDLDQEGQTPRKRRQFSTAWRYLSVLAIVAVVGLAVQQRAHLMSLLAPKAGSGVDLTRTVAKPVKVTPEQTSAAQAEPAPPDDPLIPKSYGVYAVSSGKLFPLELLPGRAPDARVAVSAAIPTPSRTTLPDAHIRFVVFRRDSATNALDHAEVRIIAKVAQAMSFDPSGKPIIAKGTDSWVIRNISIPYQTAPVQGHSDMYEVLAGDADKALEPGRYGLILKNEVYDFTVAGEIKDSRHCLESVAAVNGSFYSECRKR